MTYFIYFLGNIEATHPGNRWSVPTCFVDELEELTCAIHGQSRFSSVDELRLQKFKEECENQSAGASRNIDLHCYLPCAAYQNGKLSSGNLEACPWNGARNTSSMWPWEELTETLIEYTDAEAFADNEDHEDDVSGYNYDETVSEESDDD